MVGAAELAQTTFWTGRGMGRGGRESSGLWWKAFRQDREWEARRPEEDEKDNAEENDREEGRVHCQRSAMEACRSASPRGYREEGDNHDDSVQKQ